MAITPSYLRENLYSILDQVAETGASPEIIRKGRKMRIVTDQKPDIFSRLKKRPKALPGDPDAIVHMDWSRYWHDDLP
jgi:hypothetical protein